MLSRFASAAWLHNRFVAWLQWSEGLKRSSGAEELPTPNNRISQQ